LLSSDAIADGDSVTASATAELISVDTDVIYRWRDEMADLIEAAVKY
jgi:hypothetical protein